MLFSYIFLTLILIFFIYIQNSQIKLIFSKTQNNIFLYLNNTLQHSYSQLNTINASIFDKFVFKSSWLPNYYTRNENLWVDGFLFDFLQKKTADAWIRQWVIYTGFLFSERLVFDSVVRLYLDNIIWPLHDKSIFEVSNTSEMLIMTIFLYFTMLILFFSFYIIYLI